MPQIDFDPANKKTGFVEFDKLKLKKDERARILVIEKPTFAYVHDLRAPKLVDGMPVKVWRDKRGNTGEKEEVFDLEFIGRPLCLGDLTVIGEKGLDDTNCPACARSRKSDEVGPPTRRFAMNVIKYALRADGSPVSPFSCSCLVWNFTETKFNTLLDVAREYDGLVGRDLVLGPCTSETFQNFAIAGSPKAMWQASEETQRTVKETYDGNKIEDLDAAIGRRQERRFMEYDLEKIADAWRTANGIPTPRTVPETYDAARVGSSMESMLNEPAKTRDDDRNDTVTIPVPSSTTPAATMDFSSLLDKLNS